MSQSTHHYKFGIDFRPVQNIPDNPRERLEFFTAFKVLMRDEKEKIRAWHRDGAGGREVIQAHTCLIDAVIRHLINALASIKPYSGSNTLEEFALVAVGGYGRGEMNPFSDIDLLFLRPEKIKKITDTFIQDLISIFWGIGLEIGHSCRTIKECIQLAKEDLTIKTSMIETRFLIGQKEIYEDFNQSFEKNVLKKNIKQFLDSKLKEKYSRYGMEDGLVGTREPNIKEGAGGLRDYHTALWATAVRFGCLSIREIGQNAMISKQEVDTLYESVNFLLRVRNELHYLVEKKSDVLSLDIQKKLAANLNYTGNNETACVENFMRDYFLHATNIKNFSHTVFELCRQTQRSFKSVLSTLTQKSLGDGFIAKDSTLLMEGNLEERFQNDRTLLLKPFELCRKNNLAPDFGLKRQLHRHKHLLDEEFIKETSVKNFLFSLLEEPHAEKGLRLLHESEILGQILPEFGRAHCMVSYDFYHRYTADEHSLRMVHFLEELIDPDGHGLDELAQIYQKISKKPLLKFAVLLISIGKDHGSQTSCNQGDILSAITDRLKLTASEAQTLSFLIANQIEMIETALHQDIHEPEIIKNFAEKVGNEERLKLLYLISYADLRAVAPGTWTAWKSVLLSDLYHRILQHLERPASLKEKSKTTSDEVYKALQSEFPVEEIEQHLARLPKNYLLSSISEEIALHLRLIRSLKDKRFIFHHQYNEAGNFHNVTLCCLAKLEAFKKLVGTLTAKNLNILSARIYLKKDGIVIITLQVGAAKEDPKSLKVWKDVKRNLGEIFEGRMDLRTLFAARTRYVVAKTASLAIIPKIQVDNAMKTPFTIVRIEARDHIGMLYKIATVFSEFGIQIHRAKISTKGDRGIDVFYVSLNDKKIVFPKLILRIKDKLVQILLIDKLEDIG
ncbi:MAG: [protein-PII] uridylyltransferase [Nitrospinae bacterium]|jgi:[protein-PII] uridylyltransferase|nr:[protein-PII] uridylyltransferase [Nitrospinota bacterium]MDA1110540.1 [protein-PII] uridylyltransferase [Nitrospinota bacterium]